MKLVRNLCVMEYMQIETVIFFILSSAVGKFKFERTEDEDKVWTESAKFVRFLPKKICNFLHVYFGRFSTICSKTNMLSSSTPSSIQH